MARNNITTNSTSKKHATVKMQLHKCTGAAAPETFNFISAGVQTQAVKRNKNYTTARPDTKPEDKYKILQRESTHAWAAKGSLQRKVY